MRNFLVGLAMLFGVALGSTALAAPLGNPFCKELENPTELAGLIELSLASDPSGNTPLDPVRCKMKTPAAPNDFLRVLSESDPQSGVTAVNQLPAYFRSLVEVKTPATKYWSACLKPTRSTPSGWIAEANCIARSFHKGERAWANPVTGKIVLQGDCSNPVQLPEPPKIECAYIMVRVEQGDRALRVAEYTKNGVPLTDKLCNPAIKQVGSDDWESPWFEHCPNIDCDFRGPDRVYGTAGYGRTRKGSFKLSGPGWVILRVPVHVTDARSPYGYAWCLDGHLGHSCTNLIMPEDYRHNLAVLSYEPGLLPRQWNGTPSLWRFDGSCRD